MKDRMARRLDVQRRLEEEMERLKQATGLGDDLKVRWATEEGGNYSGEVRGNIILVYEADEAEALKTLRHEFIDNHVTKEVVGP